MIVKYFKIFLDWFHKFSKRLKDLTLIIAICIGIMYAINNGCTRKQLETMIKTTTGLSLENDLLLGENKLLDLVILEKDSLLIKNQLEKDSLINIAYQRKQQARYWKKEHDGISGELEKITSDSSYQYLITRMNYPGELKYPFNEPQVKKTHKTFLENDVKESQLEVAELELLTCRDQLILSEISEDIVEEKFKVKETQYKNSGKIIDNKEKEKELYKKKYKKEERRKKFWKIMTVVGLGLGLAVGV